MLATQGRERRVICQAEAARKLGGMPQFSTHEPYFSSPAGMVLEQVQVFSTHYICHIRMASPLKRHHAEAARTVPKPEKC